MSCTQSVPIRNLIIPQGQDWSETFTISTGGSLVSIAGSTFRGHIRKTPTSSTKTAEFTFSLNTGTNVVTFSLADTVSDAITVGDKVTDAASRYVYDVEWVDSGGTVKRIFQGTISFDPNTTRGA